MAAQRVNLNMVPNNSLPQIHLSQGDIGRQFVLNLVDSSTGYEIPAGATVTVRGTKPSGMGYTVTGTVNESAVTVVTTADMTDEFGMVASEVVITSGGTVIGSTNFVLAVEKDPHPAGTIDGRQESLIPELTLLVERVEAAAASVHDLSVSATTLAPGSAATATYDDETNQISFGIPRGADGVDGEVTQAQLDAAVTDLKSDLSDVKDVTITEVSETVTEDIASDITWTQGKVTQDGTVGTATSLRYSNSIAVSEGDVLNINPNSSFRYIAAYSNGTAVTAKGAESVVTYTVPSGIDSVIITTYISYGSGYINHTHAQTHYENILESAVSGLVSQLDAEEVTYKKMSVIPLTWTSGYVDTNGDVYTSTRLEYSNQIEVDEGDVLKYASTFRFVTAYDSSGSAVSAKGDSTGDNSSYTVPSGVAKVILTVYAPASDVKQIYDAKELVLHRKGFGYFTDKGSLGAGESFVLPSNNINKNRRLVFSADITSFSSLIIGRKTSTSGCWLAIDATNVTVYRDNVAGTPTAHGLTIANNIQVRIITHSDLSAPNDLYNADITITSNGDDFTLTNINWVRTYNDIIVQSVGSTLTNCVFSCEAGDADKAIYAFGDSYFSWYPERWTYYCAKDGFANNALFNAFAGQASDTAVASMENVVPLGLPKYLLWCLGMNDGSDSASDPNANWVSGRDAVINICKQYGITPVFGTIPTVPTINHEKKNEWIRSSGYRYIDFAKAVGAQSDGSWYSGMLESDNVHPTIKGGKALYGRVLTDFPEIMITN